MRVQQKDNILFVMPSFSLDGKKGYEKLVIQWITSLKDTKNIHILNIGSNKNNVEYNNELNVTLHNCKKNIFQSILFCFISLLRLNPLQVNFLNTSSSKKRFSRIVQDLNPKKIVFVTIRTHHLSHKVSHSKKIMLAVDSMTLNFKGKYKNSSHIKKIIYWLEYILLELNEKKILSQYIKTVFVSKRDASIYEDLITEVIPLSTSLPTIKEPSFNANGSLMFTGNMDYEPNRTAVKWFYENVWLPFEVENQDMKFTVCGRNANKWDFLKNKKDIVIKSDVLDIYHEIIDCEIYIAPMQSGSGMQYKIIEAMACARPIVSTSLGIGSIILNHHSDKLFVADDAQTTYEAIVKLHSDINLRTKLGLTAKKYVSDNYSHNKVSKQVDNLFK